jgi:hypothetical protein
MRRRGVPNGHDPARFPPNKRQKTPLSFIQTNGPLAFFGITYLLLFACIAFGTFKHRRLHPVFLWGGIFIILFEPLRLLFAGTDLWMSNAAALVRLVT